MTGSVPPYDFKYDQIGAKVNSNLGKKIYHDEIVRRNKNFLNNSSIVSSDSNDATMFNVASVANSGYKTINSNNEDSSLLDDSNI